MFLINRAERSWCAKAKWSQPDPVDQTRPSTAYVIGTRPMNASKGYESPGIAGSGAIATGLAAVSTTTADTILLARSEASAWRAEEKVVAACAKIEGAEPSRLRVTTKPDDLADCDVVVEAIVAGVAPKGELLKTIAAACPSAALATTTSSLGISEI